MAALLVLTADAGEPVVQVATIQEPVGYLANDRPPEAVLLGQSDHRKLAQLIEMVFDQFIKR